jgi:leukotriene A-4 hydrolase/aminopeptidase
MKLNRLLIALFLFCSHCSSEKTDLQRVDMRQDPHSFARPHEVVVTHLDLDLLVDFNARKISGTARLQLDNKTAAHQLYLDTRDLNIERVTLGEEETPAVFELGEPKEILGQSLEIEIQPGTKLVCIYYSTKPEAAALQWLAPEQTAGGKKPFLFTQSQAILARTWIPCQDSPGVRITYSARIKTDPELLAVMSAENPTVKNPDGVYEFKMSQPIPSYLLALAVGDLEFRQLGPRTGVYAEPAVIAKAAWELADTEKMMAAAEKLYGLYRWGRYDIIILPPSFPFGGMENPRLTFATPTILAGDRSLVALVAHELAHSWSGNLVTNATWNDFWLNEGVTTYIEHRIMEEVYGVNYASMLAVLSYHELQGAVTKFGANSPDTHLHLNLAGRDPDAAMADIAYEKGYYFLRTLEETFGREKWDAFLKNYFDRFAFQTITSAEFLDYLRQQLIKGDTRLEKQLQLDAWVYGPGIPANAAQAHSEEFEKVKMQLNGWLGGQPATDLNTGDWTTHHWLHFIRNLPETLSQQQMAELDAAFHFTDSGNSEILTAWLINVINHRYEPAYPALEAFLTRVGRRRFLEPLYEELAKTPEGLQMAKRIYQKARPGYHAISVKTIDEILKWDS